MSQKVTLKENQATYTIDVEKNDLVYPIILEQRGREVAAIISIEKYRAFESWEQQQRENKSRYPELAANKTAFEQLEPSLMENYRGKYVAIKDCQMVDSDEHKLTLIKRVYEQLGYGPLYVHKVGEPVRVARLEILSL
jgi:hypothetical protein